MLSGEPIVNLPKHTTIGWTCREYLPWTRGLHGMWTREFSTFGSPLAKTFGEVVELVSTDWWVVCPKEYS